MTTQRQYKLPNCTLVLEGLTNEVTATSQADERPLLSTVFNVECHFAGVSQPLTGGREFFESLAKTVSTYAQELLSGIPHPSPDKHHPEIVKLEKLDNLHLHRLTYQPTAEDNSEETTSAAPVQIDLTTVQLFDLVEAIDQCLTDSRTLPELGLQLQPVSKRYRKADIPVAKRAAPAALGMTSLALAAVAFFFVPIPEVREPEPISPQSNTSEIPAAGDGSTPSTELVILQQTLSRNLEQAWQNQEQIDSNLEYQVSVTEDGAIVGYNPLEATPVQAAELTPLPQLLSVQTNDETAIAQFKVVFKPDGDLEVSPLSVAR